MKDIIVTGDGGGGYGAVCACLVAEAEKQIGVPFRSFCKMLSGTSTWALIASALAAGLTGEQIILIYQNFTKDILNHGTAIADVDVATRGYMFDSMNIKRVLHGQFGAAATWTLNDSPIRLLLTAKSVNNHPWYFVCDNPMNKQKTGGLSMVECAAASAAAPWFFNAFKITPTAKCDPGYCFDGGTGTAGNPVYQAGREAFEFDSFDPQNTILRSFGTGYTVNTDKMPPNGALPTIEWVVNATVDAPIDQQTQISMAMGWDVKRINWPRPTGTTAFDPSSIPALIAYGRKLAPTINFKEFFGL
jgi:patatin-like phospholipase/acyl hydrolase